MIEHTAEAKRGALVVCLGSVVWGCGIFLRKLIITEISPILLAFYSAVIVAVTMVVIFRLRYRDLRSSFQKYHYHYLFLALSGVALASSFMYFALRELDLGITSLLSKLQPVLVLVFARVLLKEPFPVNKAHWIVLALLSAYGIAVPDPFDISASQGSFLGFAAIIAAAAGWGLCTISGKHLTNNSVPPEVIMFFRFFFGAIMLLPFFLFQEQLGLFVTWSPRLVLIVIIASVFSTALGFYFFYLGLPSITAGLSAMLELVTPLTGLFLGAVFLGERLTLTQSAAAGALLLAVYSLAKPGRDAAA